MPKKQGVQHAGLALLFLRWLSFYNVTPENLVSLSDVMLTHLSAAPGARWVSMALINGHSRRPVAGGSGRQEAQVQSRWRHSSLEAEPHLQLRIHTTEQKRGRETLWAEQWRCPGQDRHKKGGDNAQACFHSRTKWQFKPSGLLEIIISDLCVSVCLGLCSLAESS